MTNTEKRSYWDIYEGHQVNVTATDESCRKAAAYALKHGDKISIVEGAHAGETAAVLIPSNAGFLGMSFWVEGADGAKFNVYGSQAVLEA